MSAPVPDKTRRQITAVRGHQTRPADFENVFRAVVMKPEYVQNVAGSVQGYADLSSDAPPRVIH